MSLFSKFRSAINKLQRKAINKTFQKRLTNQGMSVISANCVGAFILHDLNQPFNSPFVNLYLDPKRFCSLSTEHHILSGTTASIYTNRKTVPSWSIR